MLFKLLGNMSETQFSNSVISLSDIGPLGRKISELGIPVDALELRQDGLTVHPAIKLWKLLRRVRPHILQTWLYHADLLGLMIGRMARVPVVVWNIRCSDVDMRQYSRVSALILKILIKLSPLPEALIVNSIAGRQAHTQIGYRPRRWRFIPNGFDLEEFRPNATARIRLRQELGLPQEALLIGQIARYDPMKDHQTVLRATRHLRRNFDGVELVLVGRGITTNNSSLMELIRISGIGNHVHLLEERSDVAEILPGLDVATMASAFGEGFSNSIGEAMACGVPCVVTDVGDSASIVGDTGLVVPPRDPITLAKAWGRLLAMEAEERRALGLAARRRVASHFSIDTVARQYESLYYELGKSLPEP
jgi:glycosyltransferase involved in cell wall biosynthesis